MRKALAQAIDIAFLPRFSRCLLAAFGMIAFAQCLSAGPMERSIRPLMRPGPVETAPQIGRDDMGSSQLSAIRPKMRPARLDTPPSRAAIAAAPSEATTGVDTRGLAASLRPKARPRNLAQKHADQPASPAPKAVASASKSTSAKGSVCGVAAIKGQAIAPIRSKIQGCGLEDGVRVTSVSGVRLSIAITVDCPTAKALNTWVERALQPAYGGKVTELKLAGHYVCRPRNNQKGSKVSEHGRGRAVDISAIVLNNGKVLPVLGGFDKTMRRAHKGACGIFGTTLGPGSDGYHEDHLHFDTARHRNGAYCR